LALILLACGTASKVKHLQGCGLLSIIRSRTLQQKKSQPTESYPSTFGTTE